LPNELEYTADTTVNYEVGVRSEWFDRRLRVNGAAYFIEWEGPQVSSATLTGAQPININGANSESKGFEVNFNADVTDNFSIRGSYSYNQTEFTADTRSLITVLNAPTFTNNPASFCFNPALAVGTPQSANCRIDGKSGDRLPGSPEYLASLFAKYEAPLGISDWKWNASWAFNAVGDVLSRTGGRGGSLTLPSYEQHNATLGISSERWTATLYANNVFDELIETGVTGSPLSNVTFTDDAAGIVRVRSFYTDVAPPRQVGIRVAYNFGP
jgi:outer membrane receptor protein involved in Fe transport